MPWILRSSDDRKNPTLAGGVYGKYITLGKPVYWRHTGGLTYGVILIADGGKYGLDSVESFEYNGSLWTAGVDYIFHRGTFTKQVSAHTVAVDSVNELIMHPGHPYVNGDPVRLRAVDGNLPPPLTDTILGQSQKVWICNKTANDYQLSSTDPASSVTVISFSDPGSGTLKIWKANAGFDDPIQGLPTFVPETETTFNNIAYIEFKKNIGSSDVPNWANFRVVGVGRRLMDYDASGNELGVVALDTDQLTNTALQVLDNMFWNLKVKETRPNWASWRAMRDDCDVQILQRVNTEDETPIETGFSARYFQGTNGHPSLPVYTQQVISRLDATINIPDTLGNVPPAPGVEASGFSVIWTGQLVAEYTELYTLRINHDDGAQLFVNGNLIIDEPGVGNHSATFSMVAGQTYQIELRYFQIYGVGAGNHYYCQFYWSSASQSEEIVPSASIVPSDTVVKRSRCSGAFINIEASEVHERLMERIPGWDWTDDDGEIHFLPPNREPETFTFHLDLVDDDSVATFVNKSFKKKRRALSDRKNYLLVMGRDIEKTGFPVIFDNADREELRLYTRGEPSNDDAVDLGLIYRSLMQRMAEQQMVFKTDPKWIASLDGGRSSSRLRKNQKILVKYYDRNGNFVDDEEYIITLHSWGASNDRNNFSLTPLPRVFYTDEPVDAS